jgi:hypothetical protein
VGNSRSILQDLIQNIYEYLNDPAVTLSLYRENVNELDTFQGMSVRVALYCEAESVIERTGAYKASMTLSRYNIDLTVWRGYVNDSPEQAELVLCDYRDKILDWARTVDAGDVSNLKIDYLGYDGATGITRLSRTVTQTLRLIAERDLIHPQS